MTDNVVSNHKTCHRKQNNYLDATHTHNIIYYYARVNKRDTEINESRFAFCFRCPIKNLTYTHTHTPTHMHLYTLIVYYTYLNLGKTLTH